MEVRMRAHRLNIYARHAQRLREQGQDITPSNLSARICEADFRGEERRAHNDYSSGTEEGKRLFQKRKDEIIDHLFTVDPSTTFHAIEGKDDTCFSCFKKGPLHCDTVKAGDSRARTKFVRFCRRKGFPVSEVREPHPLDPSQEQIVAITTTAAAMAYILRPAGENGIKRNRHHRKKRR